MKTIGNLLRLGVVFRWRGRQWRVTSATWHSITAVCLGPGQEGASAFLMSHCTLARMGVEITA